MSGKIVKTRKPHKCAACGEIIPKGTDGILYCERRDPVFDSNDKQISIEYSKIWFHSHNCCMPEECKKGNHVWERETIDLGYPTGYEICIECGEKRKEP